MSNFQVSILQRNACAAGDTVLGRYETGSLIASVQGRIYSVPKRVSPEAHESYAASKFRHFEEIAVYTVRISRCIGYISLFMNT